LVSDEKIVVEFFIEVKIGKRLLVGWLIFNHLLHLLHAQLADRVEVLEDLGDHYLLLPAEGLAAWDSPTEGELHCLREVLLD